MAPSTNIPTAKTKPNKTTIFMVRPSACRTKTPVKNDPGMATPTRPAERRPKDATTTIITKITALITLFSRLLRRSLIISDLSLTNDTETDCFNAMGQASRSAITTVRTCSTVSIRFSPNLFETSNVTAGLPPTRAKLFGSLKLRLTSPISANLITASPTVFAGVDMISSMVSNKPGTFRANFPRPVSCTPAATNLLAFRIPAVAWPGSIP